MFPYIITVTMSAGVQRSLVHCGHVSHALQCCLAGAALHCSHSAAMIVDTTEVIYSPISSSSCSLAHKHPWDLMT